MTACIAIVFIQYVVLSVENRVQLDGRTLGEAFYNVCDELPDIAWIESFRVLMEIRVVTAAGKIFLLKEKLESLLKDFILTLPTPLRYKLQKCVINS